MKLVWKKAHVQSIRLESRYQLKTALWILNKPFDLWICIFPPIGMQSFIYIENLWEIHLLYINRTYTKRTLYKIRCTISHATNTLHIQKKTGLSLQNIWSTARYKPTGVKELNWYFGKYLERFYYWKLVHTNRKYLCTEISISSDENSVAMEFGVWKLIFSSM